MPGKSIEFFKQINEAFIKGDTAFIEENAVDDVQWTFVGKTPVQGKSELIKAMESMESDKITDITFTHIITHGNVAAINGTMKKTNSSGKQQVYGFCHIYLLNKFTNGKVKEITTYMMPEKE